MSKENDKTTQSSGYREGICVISDDFWKENKEIRYTPGLSIYDVKLGKFIYVQVPSNLQKKEEYERTRHDTQGGDGGNPQGD